MPSSAKASSAVRQGRLDGSGITSSAPFIAIAPWYRSDARSWSVSHPRDEPSATAGLLCHPGAHGELVRRRRAVPALRADAVARPSGRGAVWLADVAVSSPSFL